MFDHRNVVFLKCQIYNSKSSEKKMAIPATLQTKLACGALMIIITNVCILIAIIAYISREELCKSFDDTKKIATLDLTGLTLFQTTVEEYPWITAFMILPEEIFIGTSAIVTNKWAVTTAYCVKKVANYPITKKGFRGGSTFWNKYGFYHYATNIVIHEKFNLASQDYNVALVEVVEPFMHVNEVPIPIKRIQFEALSSITEVVGWASSETKPKNVIDGLLRISVDLLSNKVCRETLQKLRNRTSILRSLCTYKKTHKYTTTCNFSSGSVLMGNRHLLGLTTSDVVCSESRLPGICLNIMTVIDWIKNTTMKK